MVLFSYVKDPDEFQQVIRWKFIHSRIFLDIPINEYPDFPALGGNDFVTLPYPNIVPVIGGMDEASELNESVKRTLSSGKIGENDIIDQQLLFKYNKDKEYIPIALDKQVIGYVPRALIIRDYKPKKEEKWKKNAIN